MVTENITKKKRGLGSLLQKAESISDPKEKEKLINKIKAIAKAGGHERAKVIAQRKEEEAKIKDSLDEQVN